MCVCVRVRQIRRRISLSLLSSALGSVRAVLEMSFCFCSLTTILCSLYNCLGVFFLDRNSLTGTLDGPCARGSQIELAAADCQEVNCPCCNPCCTDGDDQSCIDTNLVANISPVWELSYGRQFFDFSTTEDAIGVGDDDVWPNAGEP